MSTLLLLLILAVALYVVLGAATNRTRSRTDTVAEFSRALEALDPGRSAQRRPPRSSRGRAHRTAASRRRAA
jgi:hypothetical protein